MAFLCKFFFYENFLLIYISGETQMDLTGLQLEQTKEVKLNLTK